ncbi:MAG: hypothetical protein JNL18_20825 [Planctomycetaceae bacterium]|uniref:Uncharacterized protein n=1 Tax=Lacipirellula limnantheis TaxID=2528024 RepID=A0A517U2M5_9BACT|nr:hypothetical protein [Lacipirellula limnantheis]MBL9165183.1 hypothetical protein [Planctomycetaceae bacterium]QDT74874.1 hypothetical protein I41_40780 [Lacipirellula limnantheis]
MSDQIPLPAGAYRSLPPVTFDDGALLKFGREIHVQLRDLEAKFVVPRVHPKAFLGVARQAPRRPR